MSIQQGLISPPLSGRTHKSDQPRIGEIHKAISAVDVFGPVTHHQAEPCHFGTRHAHHITSPVKKHRDDDLSEAERAVRPLTPPMSKDVRHDAQTRQREEQASRHRTNSQIDPFEVPASASSCTFPTYAAAPVEARPASASASASTISTSRSGLLEAARIGNRFDTLNNGVDFASDDDHNPFLDRKRPSSSSSSHRQASNHLRPHYDEFDSDLDAEGSVHQDDLHGDATPRASSSNATTPPARIGNAPTYRLARPFSTRVRVDNEPVTSTMPIRDTPKNPFLAGGPADNGFQGPNGHLAYHRARRIPGKEKGKITYVFRGQRVTYADPEYDSDDDDDSDQDQFNPHYKRERQPRLEPKLLFPLAVSSAYATGSSSGRHREGRNSGGGGLFAAQITAKQQQRQDPTTTAAAPRVAPCYPSRSSSYESARSQEEQKAPVAARHNGAPTSSSRLQTVMQLSHADSKATSATINERRTGDQERQSAREALLARLDQTNWSDDEEEEDHSHRRWARADSKGTDEQEYPIQQSQMPCSQSQRKRLSDELQQGHAEETDGTGRPIKRGRASYAY